MENFEGEPVLTDPGSRKDSCVGDSRTNRSCDEEVRDVCGESGDQLSFLEPVLSWSRQLAEQLPDQTASHYFSTYELVTPLAHVQNYPKVRNFWRRAIDLPVQSGTPIVRVVEEPVDGPPHRGRLPIRKYCYCSASAQWRCPFGLWPGCRRSAH